MERLRGIFSGGKTDAPKSTDTEGNTKEAREEKTLDKYRQNASGRIKRYNLSESEHREVMNMLYDRLSKGDWPDVKKEKQYLMLTLQNDFNAFKDEKQYE